MGINGQNFSAVKMIDTHVHFWQYHPIKDDWITDDMSVIQANFYPKDLEGVFAKHQIKGCVAVQASQSEDETNFLLDLASKSPLVKGIVGWVDLRAENLAERLQHFAQYPLIKGWRHIVQAEPAGFLLQRNFVEGVKQLKTFGHTYDILINYKQYPEAIKFVEQFSGQPFVIDHCGKPDIKTGEKADFKNYVKEIALHPDVFCKISGLLTEADWHNWNNDEIYRYLDIVFDAFGPQKIMYGSDWPVVKLAGNYERWLNLVTKYLEQFTADEQLKVLEKNAVEFYRLDD